MQNWDNSCLDADEGPQIEAALQIAMPSLRCEYTSKEWHCGRAGASKLILHGVFLH